jgi:sigma-B regulation protein RsbU (phosphoserine phosphatase)
MIQDNYSQFSYLRHELRTPINAIVGYSEMLLEELEAESEPKFLDELQNIREQGVELLSLVNQILHPDTLDKNQFSSDNLSETLQVKLQAPTQAIIYSCQELLAQATKEYISDLEKINKAAEKLIAIVDHFELDNSVFIQSLPDYPNILNSNSIGNSEEEILVNSYSFSNYLISEDSSITKITSEATILLVDDNETNRDLLSRQIEAQGYQTATAADGQEALQMIQTGKYDLILLDIIMPKMNGYELLKSLRNSQWRNIPVIMISALDELDSVVKCIEMGAEDYLGKPFNSVLLRARIGACLEQKRLRDQESLYLAELAQANQEISKLNERLKTENLRLSAELEITKRLQEMILPKDQELKEISQLEIAGFMEPADEVGGDYYDVLQISDRIKIGIGDVTGHGLESGVLMIMVQTAVRTLMENNETDPRKFLEVINRTIYKNVQRMNSDKNLSLCLVDYEEGNLSLSGQHEEIVVVRSGGIVERIDTIDLGFPIGLEETIADFVFQVEIQLNSQDIVVLYTDGITEAENSIGVQYGIERLCEIVKNNWQQSAKKIRELVIGDLRNHINKHTIYDDITLVILKQK